MVCIMYVGLDRKAGSLAALLCGLCWVGSSFVANRLGFSLAWKVVLAAQLFCWTGQFIGHGVFEKRAPALLDNLVQAFLMAPFFELLEKVFVSLVSVLYYTWHTHQQQWADNTVRCCWSVEDEWDYKSLALMNYEYIYVV